MASQDDGITIEDSIDNIPKMDMDDKPKKKLKELDPTMPCFYPSKPFIPNGNEKTVQIVGEIGSERGSFKSMADLSTSFSQLSPNDSGLGSVMDNESGSDSGASPPVSVSGVFSAPSCKTPNESQIIPRGRYGSMDSEWSSGTPIRNTANDELPFDYSNTDLLTPVTFNIRNKSKRQCSTPARLDDVGDSSKTRHAFGDTPESPKSSLTASSSKQASEADKMMENLTVVGLEVPFIVLDSESNLKRTEYYWFPHRPEFKIKSLERDRKQQFLYEQLSSRIHCDEQFALWVRATMDGQGNFQYILTPNDLNSSGAMMLQAAYKLR